MSFNIKIIFGVLLVAVAAGVVYSAMSDKKLSYEYVDRENQASKAYMEQVQKRRKDAENDNKEIVDRLGGVACYGGTYSAGNAFISYADTLAILIKNKKGYSIPVENLGVRNETSVSVLAREGTLPILIDSFKIGAQPELLQVKVKGSKGDELNVLCGSDNPGLNTVEIDGIEGTLYGKTDANDYTKTSEFYFYREEAGDEHEVKANTVVNTYAMREYSNYVSVLWIGDDGGYDSLNELFEQYSEFKKAHEGKRYLVIGKLDDADYKEYLTRCKEMFGDNFVDMRELLLTYSQEYVNKGDKPVSDSDRKLLEQGIYPSFIIDKNGNLTTSTIDKIAEWIYLKIDEKGFIE